MRLFLINFIKRIDDKNYSLLTLFSTFTAVVIIRTFFELWVTEYHKFFVRGIFYDNLITIIYYYLFYLGILISGSLLLSTILRVKFFTFFKFFVLFFAVTIFVPIIDVVVTQGGGFRYVYLFTFDEYFYYLIHLFNPFVILDNIMIGMRVEAFLIAVMSFLYSKLYLKKNIFISIIASFSLVLLVFTWGHLPAINNLLIPVFGLPSLTDLSIVHSYPLMYVFPFIALFALLTIKLFFENKKYKILFQSIFFPTRLFYYLFLLSFGFLYGAYIQKFGIEIFNLLDVQKFLSASISVILIFAYAKIINDISDYNIDVLSNKNRMLPIGVIKKNQLQEIKYIFLFYSLLFAIITDYSFIAYWLMFFALSYIYSIPPYRLKKYYPLSFINLSILGIVVFISGLSLVFHEYAYIKLPQKEIVLYVALSFFAILHIKDFKDIDSDKKNKIFSLVHVFKFPKLLAVICVLIFTILFWKICQIIELNYVNYVLIAYLFISIMYIIYCRKTAKIDRIFLITIAPLFAVSVLWIYQNFCG
jgi:4-hydroxybenzoate polyprenyltransferase